MEAFDLANRPCEYACCTVCRYFMSKEQRRNRAKKRKKRARSARARNPYNGNKKIRSELPPRHHIERVAFHTLATSRPPLLSRYLAASYGTKQLHTRNSSEPLTLAAPLCSATPPICLLL